MPTRHWIVVAIILVFVAVSSAFALKATLPKLPEMVGPIEADSPLALLLKVERPRTGARLPNVPSIDRLWRSRIKKPAIRFLANCCVGVLSGTRIWGNMRALRPISPRR